MFNRTPKPIAHELDATITNLISTIQGMDEYSPEYLNATNSLKVLMELRNADTAFQNPRISPDTWVQVAASLGGIIAILGFEKANVITTKSLSLLPKIKI